MRGTLTKDGGQPVIVEHKFDGTYADVSRWVRANAPRPYTIETVDRNQYRITCDTGTFLLVVSQ
mgnify:CR=1 FL=1